MKVYNSIIHQYISSKTDYALLINGEWGIGKTFYVKNTLSQLINNTKIDKSDNPCYRVIYVSVFGIKEIEELQKLIFYEIFPILKDKKIKLGVSFGKLFLRGLLSISKLGDIDKYLDEYKTRDYISNNKEEIVLLIDDFERIDANISIDEISGFLTNLVFNNTKVIIVCNEEKIVNKSRYNELKEKYIGNTIEFKPDFETLANEVLSDNYKDKSIFFYEFISPYIDLIVGTFKNGETNNLRTLKFCLRILDTIYKSVDFNDLKNNKEAAFRFEERIENLLLFTCAVAIEYKKRNIEYLNSRGIDKFKYEGLIVLTHISQDYDVMFKHKYYNNNNMIKHYKGIRSWNATFYHSIYDLITAGIPIDKNQLTNEFISVFPYNIKIDPNYQPYDVSNKLGVHSINLTDNEYYHNVTLMLDYADKGYYSPGDYPFIFHQTLYYENLLKFNVKELANRLILGMKKSSTVLNLDLDYTSFVLEKQKFEFIKEDSPYFSEYIRIAEAAKDYCKGLNATLLEKHINEKINYIFTNYLSDPNSIMKEIRHDTYLSKFPSFHLINVEQLFENIVKLDNQKLRSFFWELDNRYSGEQELEKYNKELEFYKIIIRKMDKLISSLDDKSLRRYFYKELNNTLINLRNKLEDNLL